MPIQGGRIRTKLSQPRSVVRLDAILDATAEIVDEIGYATLTTALVADRAGASIGTVYRYFPDRIALLRALRDRAVQRFRSLVVDTIHNASSTRISDGAAYAIDAFVHMHKQEPGFRIIRFEGSDITEDLDDFERPGFFARQFVAIVSEEFDIAYGEELVFRMEVVVETCNALVTRAFKLDPDGDEKFIHEARLIARRYLQEHFDIPAQ